MRKDISVKSGVFPMPVLIIAAYDAEGKVQLMNAAWGMTSSEDKLALFISEGHATTKAIRESKAFTVSIADKAHVKEADYVGIASGNSVSDKFEKTGLKAVKSTHVNAPVLEDFPICMECELEGIRTEDGYTVIGKVVNTSVDESVLTPDGKVDVEKTGAIMFDLYRHGYYEVGAKVGQAWSDGKDL